MKGAQGEQNIIKYARTILLRIKTVQYQIHDKPLCESFNKNSVLFNFHCVVIQAQERGPTDDYFSCKNLSNRYIFFFSNGNGEKDFNFIIISGYPF